MYSKKILLSVLVFCFILFVIIFYTLDIIGAKEELKQPDKTCQIAFDDEKIYLNNESMAMVDGNRVIIGKSGNYQITGNSQNAEIIVDTTDKDSVNIVLDNLNLKSQTSSPFYIKDSGDINILLIGYNSFEDAKDYDIQNEDITDACIYSKSDMAFMGDGYLSIKGINKDGIFVKGNLDINAGQYDIYANGDGIKVKSKKDLSKGCFSMDNGMINIEAGDEGIQADSEICIQGGEVRISSIGDYIKCDGEVSINQECVYLMQRDLE